MAKDAAGGGSHDGSSDQELQRGFARNVVSVLRLVVSATDLEFTLMLRSYIGNV